MHERHEHDLGLAHDLQRALAAPDVPARRRRGRLGPGGLLARATRPTSRRPKRPSPPPQRPPRRRPPTAASWRDCRTRPRPPALIPATGRTDRTSLSSPAWSATTFAPASARIPVAPRVFRCPIELTFLKDLTKGLRGWRRHGGLRLALRPRWQLLALQQGRGRGRTTCAECRSPTSRAACLHFLHQLPGLLRRPVAAHPLRGLRLSRKLHTSVITSRLTSQIALPEDTCKAVYAADKGYEKSVQNLSQVTLNSDNVFGDGWDAEIATVTGDPNTAIAVVLDDRRRRQISQHTARGKAAAQRRARRPGDKCADGILPHRLNRWLARHALSYAHDMELLRNVVVFCCTSSGSPSPSALGPPKLRRNGSASPASWITGCWSRCFDRTSAGRALAGGH